MLSYLWSRSSVLLLLPSAIAFAQISLIWRSGPGPANFLIINLLVWFCAGVLWLECIEAAPSPDWGRFSPLALPLLLWVLLLLSRPYTLYEPLLNAIPLATLVALFLLLREPPGRSWLVLGLLPPVHYAVMNLVPTGLLAVLTADYSAQVLWLSGVSVVPDGPILQLPGRSLIVSSGCTGLNVMSLSLASVAALLLLNGPLPWRRGLILLASAPLLAFLVNGLRVSLLCLTPLQPSPGPLAAWINFEFWHRGPGSMLFSFVVVLLLFFVEHQLRQSFHR